MKLKKILATAISGVMAFGVFSGANIDKAIRASAEGGDTTVLLYEGDIGAEAIYYMELDDPKLNLGVNGERIRITFSETLNPKTNNTVVYFNGIANKLDGTGTTNISPKSFKGSGTSEEGKAQTVEFSLYEYLAGAVHTSATTGVKDTPSKSDMIKLAIRGTKYLKDNSVKVEVITPAQKPDYNKYLYYGVNPVAYDSSLVTGSEGVIFTAKELGKGRGNPTITFTLTPSDTTGTGAIRACPRKYVDGKPQAVLQPTVGGGAKIGIPNTKVDGWERGKQISVSYTYDEFLDLIHDKTTDLEEIEDFIFLKSTVSPQEIFSIEITGATEPSPEVEITVPEDSTLSLSGRQLSDKVANDVDSYTVNVNVNDGGTYKLYSDSDCTKVIANNKMSLEDGQNTAYLLATSKDGELTKTYTVVITRKQNAPKGYDMVDVFDGALTTGGGTTIDIAPEDLGKGIEGAKIRFTFTASQDEGWGVIGLAGKKGDAWLQASGNPALSSGGKGVLVTVEMTYDEFVKLADIGDDLDSFSFLSWGLQNNNHCLIQLLTLNGEPIEPDPKPGDSDSKPGYSDSQSGDSDSKADSKSDSKTDSKSDSKTDSKSGTNAGNDKAPGTGIATCATLGLAISAAALLVTKKRKEDK